MLCDKNMRILDEEIERLEQKELTWQTCDKLCMLYNLKKHMEHAREDEHDKHCLLYTSPSPRDLVVSRMPSSA